MFIVCWSAVWSGADLTGGTRQPFVCPVTSFTSWRRLCLSTAVNSPQQDAARRIAPRLSRVTQARPQRPVDQRTKSPARQTTQDNVGVRVIAPWCCLEQRCVMNERVKCDRQPRSVRVRKHLKRCAGIHEVNALATSLRNSSARRRKTRRLFVLAVFDLRQKSTAT